MLLILQQQKKKQVNLAMMVMVKVKYSFGYIRIRVHIKEAYKKIKVLADMSANAKARTREQKCSFYSYVYEYQFFESGLKRGGGQSLRTCPLKSPLADMYAKKKSFCTAPITFPTILLPNFKTFIYKDRVLDQCTVLHRHHTGFL